MTTRYVESRGEKPVRPIKVGTWPTAIFRAEPVMKADIDVSDIRSTIQPHRARPIAKIIHPEISARADATTFGGMSGCVAFTLNTMFPTIVDMTATGYSTVSLLQSERRLNLYLRLS